MNWLSHIGRQASRLASLELFRYIGPGFFVTVGFIDPGNWVTNVAAGSQFGYNLLWVVTLSTIILIIVQHNAAHLGIVTGLCLSEAASKFFKPWLRLLMLGSAMLGEVGRVGKLHKPRVEQAGFAVLKAPDIPSVLVETAFISNPEEEVRLKSVAYQTDLADALLKGIVRYFSQNPPLARTRQM